MSVTYKIRYARHARSLSNDTENEGVDIYDPPLINSEDGELMFQLKRLGESEIKSGEEYALEHMHNKFEKFNKNSTVFIISPLTRVVQTFVYAVPTATLKCAKIVVEPLLVEQTRWFSDRARSIDDIKAIIKESLENKTKVQGGEPLNMSTLNIDWSRMLKPRDSNGEFTGEILEHEHGDQGWNLKDEFWDPSRLIDRGLRANREIIKNCRDLAADNEGLYPEFGVCVFGHGGFANYMTQHTGLKKSDLDGIPKLSAWSTGEIREFEIEDDPSKEPTAKLLKQISPALKMPGCIEAEDQMRTDLVKYLMAKDAMNGTGEIQYGGEGRYGYEKQDTGLAKLYRDAELRRRNPDVNEESLQKYTVKGYRKMLRDGKWGTKRKSSK